MSSSTECLFEEPEDGIVCLTLFPVSFNPLHLGYIPLIMRNLHAVDCILLLASFFWDFNTTTPRATLPERKNTPSYQPLGYRLYLSLPHTCAQSACCDTWSPFPYAEQLPFRLRGLGAWPAVMWAWRLRVSPAYWTRLSSTLRNDDNHFCLYRQINENQYNSIRS